MNKYLKDNMSVGGTDYRGPVVSTGGFTLIETLIYIAIIGGVVATFLSFSLSITSSRNKSYVIQEVQANTRVALQMITQSIRAAESVSTSTSIFGVDPGFLYLNMASSTLNPTLIGLNADNGSLEIKTGNFATTTITSSEVKVSNLVFTNLTSSGSRESIRIQLTVDFASADSVDVTFSQSAMTAVSVRR